MIVNDYENIISLSCLIIIFLLYKYYNKIYQLKLQKIQKELLDNADTISKMMAGQIINNKFYNGKDGSVAFIFNREEITVQIERCDIFTIPINCDKYIPQILHYLREHHNQ